MRTTSTAKEILSAEKLILRALCRGALPDSAFHTALTILTAYRWHDKEHRIIFESLALLRSSDPEIIRANLAATATRRGFPDLDVEIYLARGALPNQDWLALIRSLVGDAAPRSW
jgi:hypothetical protein